MDEARSVTVSARRRLTPDAVELRLAPVGPDLLPDWEPGSHIDLVLPSGLVRQYSLCGSPQDREYTIAVLREVASRGGSVEVHDRLAVGDVVTIRGPRNHFPLADAPHVILVAGGIGITPLLAMARRLAGSGAPWDLHYGGRTRASIAYADEVTSLARSGGGTVTLYPQDEVGLLPLGAILAAAPPGAVVHACGPEPLLVAVEARGAERGVPVRVERFVASSTAAAGAAPDTAFSVTLGRSGRTLPVPVRTRLIDVVREVVPGVPFSCEEGLCGSCETGVLEGLPDHRDSVLTADERAANDTMMICVGRSRTPRLVLDL